MKISVFGIGYVGSVSAACLSEAGHDVVAVDVASAKVDLLNAGRSPISEPGLAAIINARVTGGHLRATTNAEEAVLSTELSLVCVGTPSAPNGDLDPRYALRACEQIAHSLRKKSDFHMLVVRSTILPGTMEQRVLPLIREASGRRPGIDIGIAYYPEFLREGSAIRDFQEPETVVVGRIDDRTAGTLVRLNEGNRASTHIVDLKTAEAIKYANNAWHAVKVSFANEIGNICKGAGIDGRTVMSILCSDSKLNISAAYLRPGFAFGGSCLPKDLRALSHFAKSADIQSFIVNAAIWTNSYQIDRAVAMVSRPGKRRVAILGLTFKPHTDDLRESPMVELAERLLGKGFDVSIFDRDLEPGQLMGRNERFVMEHLPHLQKLLVSGVDEALARSDVIVVGTAHPEFSALRSRLRTDHYVVDLAGRDDDLRNHTHYDGACW